MPKYVFECQEDGCNLRFERILKMGEHPTHKCPNCEGVAPRVLDQEGFAFAFAQPEKAAPGNTGVHKDDYPTADRIVGKDADVRWSQYAEKEKGKEAVRKANGTHALQRQQGKDFINYTPLSKEAFETRKKTAKRAIELSRSTQEGRRGR